MYRLGFACLFALSAWLLQSASPGEKRQAWTTSKFTGSPEAPPPYQTERVFPDLKFKDPVTLARMPGTKRLTVVELRGPVLTFPDEQSCKQADLLIDLSKITNHWRTYGLTFHPQFEKNRQIFICYVLKAPNPKGSRVSRFRVSDTEPPTIDPASEEVLFEWPSGGHNGGCLQFGPDGMLYISTGDGTDPAPPDRIRTGQDISDYLASMLRIDVDHPDPGMAYGVPKDNPFLTTPKAKPEIWAYGLRNPWKMAFDKKTGHFWCADVGWEMWEMIYKIEKGGNYGWSVMEGRQPVLTEAPRGPTPVIPPVVDHAHTEARSITGGIVYYGKELPKLNGAYIYGDYVTGKIWGLRHDGSKLTWTQFLADSPIEVIDFNEDTRGELLILDYSGPLFKLVPNPQAVPNKDFPKTLSSSGLYASAKDAKPAPGVFPYKVNAEPWSDHASAERLFAVPNLGTMGRYEKSNLQAGVVKNEWIFPKDTVFAKTMSLEMRRGDPSSRKRIETRILHKDGPFWRAYNYVWNDDQTDAVLADAEGFDRTYTIVDPQAPGGKSQQTWHFASRTECLICHTTRAGSILGFNEAQVPPDRVKDLQSLGCFEQPLLETVKRLPNPFDATANLELRARAYLHSNCGQCHRQGGGGTASFQLLFDLDLEKTKIVGSRPTQGTFDIHGAQNIAPGNPYASILYYRMAKLGSGHMPHAGSSVIDAKGLDLIHDWIASLPTKNPDPKSAWQKSLAAGDFEGLLATTSGALYLMHAFDHNELGDSQQKQALALATKHPRAEVRDLFERFLPDDQRVKRLGAAIKPASILAIDGVADRGREVFLKGTQCKTCHRIGKEGQEVGPDLSTIGKKLNRTQILESILEPSKTIDPAFVTHLVETAKGQVITGLLVRKTDKELVLKDAQGKIVTVPMDEVEVHAPQGRSLMPELLLRDLTPQDAADLLAYLASLR